MAFNWTCPHCDRPQTVADSRVSRDRHNIAISDLVEGPVTAQTVAIGCANPECFKLTLHLVVTQQRHAGSTWKRIDGASPLVNLQIIPQGTARPQPDYIPEPIRQDYKEACLIRDLSPKASATMARRAIQGMIRDFCNIKGRTLAFEINTLRAAVDDGSAPRSISVESVNAIDDLRKVGNIGAHMEQDINVIIDVDPGEAQGLIGLVESLMRDWYVDRHDRQARFDAIAQISAKKAQAKITAPVEASPMDEPQSD